MKIFLIDEEKHHNIATSNSVINGQDEFHIEDEYLARDNLGMINKDIEQESSLVENSNSIPNFGQFTTNSQHKTNLQTEFEEKWKSLENKPQKIYFNNNSKCHEGQVNNLAPCPEKSETINRIIKELNDSLTFTDSNSKTGNRNINEKQKEKKPFESKEKESDFDRFLTEQQLKLNDIWNRNNQTYNQTTNYISIINSNNEKSSYIKVKADNSFEERFKQFQANPVIISVYNRFSTNVDENKKTVKKESKLDFMKSTSVIVSKNRFDHLNDLIQHKMKSTEKEDYNSFMTTYLSNMYEKKKYKDEDNESIKPTLSINSNLKDKNLMKEINSISFSVQRYKSKLKDCEENITSMLRTTKLIPKKAHIDNHISFINKVK